MSKFNQNEQAGSKLDHFFQSKLKNVEANDLPKNIWNNITAELSQQQHRTKNDYLYFLIIALLIPLTTANVMLNYKHIMNEYYLVNSYPEEHNLTVFNPLQADLIRSMSLPFEHSKTKLETNNFSKSLSSVAHQNFDEAHSNQLIVSSHNDLQNHLSNINAHHFASNSDKNDKKSIHNHSHSFAHNLNSEEWDEARAIPESTVQHDFAKGIISYPEKLMEPIISKYDDDHFINYQPKQTLKDLTGWYVSGDVKIYNAIMLIKESATNSFVGRDVQYHFKQNIAFALTGGYNFNHRAGVEAEVFYAKQGHSFIDNTSKKLPFFGDVKIAYVKMPVLFKVRFSKILASTQHARVFNVLAGPVYSHLIHSNFLLSSELFSKNVVVPKNELGITMGIEYEVYATKSLFFSLGTRGSISTGVRSFPYFGNQNLETLNVDLSINASVGFQFTKKLKTPKTF